LLQEYQKFLLYFIQKIINFAVDCTFIFIFSKYKLSLYLKEFSGAASGYTIIWYLACPIEADLFFALAA